MYKYSNIYEDFVYENNKIEWRDTGGWGFVLIFIEGVS